MVGNKSAYLAMGVDLDGKKQILGLWLEANEGSKFWLKVITELKNRGIEDIFIACCDGLKGFPEAIEAVFPKTVVQTCIVHLIRNSTRFVVWTKRKALCADLKRVYGAETRTRPCRRSTPSRPLGAKATRPSWPPGVATGSECGPSSPSPKRSGASSTPPTPSSRSTTSCARSSSPRATSQATKPPPNSSSLRYATPRRNGSCPQGRGRVP